MKEEYDFALSHMFFHDMAWMKNLSERMNEKEIICIVSRTFPAPSHFSWLFHNFLSSFPQEEQKHTLQQLEHSWGWPRAKEPHSGSSCPQAGLFFPRASFNYVLTTTKSTS